MSGDWQGDVAIDGARAAGSAACSLTQKGTHVTGTLALDAGDVHGTFDLVGRMRGNTVRLRGRLGPTRLAWRGIANDDLTAWQGPVHVRKGRHKMHGMLDLARGAARCGDDYFASDVMPKVLEPICAQCHVQGGAAANAPFRVTVGDPVATVLSAVREVDAVDVLQSKILKKPLGDLPHGGGRRLMPDSAEAQVLVEWLDRLTAPGCKRPGGGGGHPDTGAGLYAENCASCHGADARGLDGRPDVHCSRSIYDAVRHGRPSSLGDMPPFDTLTDVEIGKIQTYLDGLCPITSVTGAELYASNCATCHGADAEGAGDQPAVRCSLDPRSAVRDGRGTAMPAFPFTDGEIALVVDFLDARCTAVGRPGGDLFAGNCAACHGPDGHGGQSALGVEGSDVHCNRELSDAVRTGRPPDMPSFVIGDGDLTSLQQFVNGLCSAGSGADLFTSNCASCHGPDALGVAGKGPAVRCSKGIRDPVRSGRRDATPPMPGFPHMTDGDIASIQGFLNGLCPAGSATGPELYGGNCGSCHGLDAGGTDTGPSVRCATRIADPIMNGRADAMPSFPALLGADLATLTGYLGQVCAQHGRTGRDLYAGNCATCHGATATGGTNALGVDGPDIQCNRSIAEPVRDGNDDMPAFPGLSDADIAAVQQHLIDLCPAGTATGAQLFASNCETCHGADARGVDGNPNIRCNRAIHDVVSSGRGTMPAFAEMSDAEIARLQSHLVGLCPAGSATGPDLYAANCATCHAPDAGGIDTAPNVRCSTRVADALTNGRGAAMPSFPALNGADLTTLTGYLGQLCTQYGRTGAALWAGNCSTCHGAAATGGTNALGVDGPDVQCARNIGRAVRDGEDEMPAFPGMSDPDVSALQQYLLALCPSATATGARLFAGNCQSCHGADARGTGGDPDIRCNRGIHDPVRAGRGAMPAFALMPDAEIGRVQTHLVGLCPPGSATGTALYSTNCAGCHGLDAGGTGTSPNVRCATRVANAIQQGRATAMPSFAAMGSTDLASLTTHLAQVCTQYGRTGDALWAGNCSTCHGANAKGGRNALGVRGPGIACTENGDYQEKVRFGDDDMPAFPPLGTGDVDAIVTYVHGAFCPGGG